MIDLGIILLISFIVMATVVKMIRTYRKFKHPFTEPTEKTWRPWWGP
jgi:hypothetical protein